ncbi:hypothetical protein ASG60_18785 [Methylobacterium sp. Leaf469]|uniref:hypothetical protein n=1 Tax=Methylobacterium sp. Leaf469 TaxID=1736387 RepID=UPI0006F34216|nr:hypothetical protein [Methylobacterium sp. Leaf469]KQU01084.1 hypothetical protein ASG60_18785 [Methylobacterium sp. Leaf469]
MTISWLGALITFQVTFTELFIAASVMLTGAYRFGCTLMGIELFGATHGVYLAVACFLAYLCSGYNGIYLS